LALPSIYRRLAATETFLKLSTWCESLGPPSPSSSLQVRGLAGSTAAFLVRFLDEAAASPYVCVTPDEETAAYLFGDVAQLFADDDRILRLPSTGHKPYDQEQMDDPAPLIARADVLQQIADGFDGLIVTSIDALFEMVPSAEIVQRETIPLATGMVVAPAELAGRLVELGFERVEFVEQPGEVALRGGILDVYPFAGEYPIRAEFFGDDIDSIREFDPGSQRSVSRLTTARLVPNLERRQGSGGTYISIFEHLPDRTLIVTLDEERLINKARDLYAAVGRAYEEAVARDAGAQHADPAARYLSADAFERSLIHHHRLLLGTFAGAGGEDVVTFPARPQPDFNGNIGLLRKQILENAARDVDTFILCDSRGQEQRLFELLEEETEEGKVRFSVESLHEGFEVPSVGLAVYTDHQIFNRYHRPTTRGRARRYGGLSLREIKNLSLGDFVVHVDYGIGRFAGLHRITVRGKQQEAVKVIFRDEDVLYVNVNALYKLHKYSGKEGHKPRLTKLGSGQWERTKARTKSKVKDIARDLIKLYARRKASPGVAFSRDTIWQREMEASFRYEDTPDQALASEAVKEDMQEPVPMDRLVCGDVGFGKTEVAVRAAFKAVQDGKQVGVLVPTTILAAQHFETISLRLEKYPVRVDVLSRFRSTAEQKEVLRQVESGEVDIVVGTHRLTSSDVRFKDLGLLIIDEEQRFGVAVKERLRKMRAEVDTLTLTATPIPRTLQFSLLGARDLSLIATAPPNRQPIATEIHTFDKDLIRDAILYEVSRGGQVFFIHNRVRSIDEMAATLRLIVPDVRIRTAHGQMKSSELEDVMMDFIEGRFDVLVSTNIIENGLDISNANTIVINRADRFGLAELHQLRGRVGRSDRKAFCYLLVPSIHGLTREARQRLQAVEEFSDLGSGFNLAMRDMDIRGAGNLLGGEQSGFVEDVGFETYHKILDEAVLELREQEFQDVFDEEHVPRPQETTVDVEEDAFIPETFVSNNVERLNIYRRISEAEDVAALSAVRDEIVDRFGELPPEVDHLLAAAEMRFLATQLRLPKVLFKNERLFLYTPSQEDDPYFYERIFYDFLELLSKLDRRYVLKDKDGKKLRAIVQDVRSLAEAKTVLQHLQLEGAVAA
jgi:transcription-repair coupling factor (superfamily II helicase)